MLKTGDEAPDFSARDSNGEMIRLGDFRERKNVVLYFYPADFSLGCTKEACQFRDGFASLESRSAVVIGVSPDDEISHRRFASSYNLPFHLISDLDKSISRAYGALWPLRLAPFAKRVTYVIDKKGIVRLATHHEIMIWKHFEKVQGVLRELQDPRPRD